MDQNIDGRYIFLTPSHLEDFLNKSPKGEVIYYPEPRYEQCAIGKDIFTKLGVDFTVRPIFKRTFGV